MIALIDYGAGNIRSVQNALKRLNCEVVITKNKDIIKAADKVVFPGVGEASSAMNALRENGIDTLIPTINVPFLGICLGLQLLCSHSEEGDTKCLGIFEAKVRCFPPRDIVPQMGWNNCSSLNGPLFDGLTTSDDFYFVHSYYAEIEKHTTAVCDYITGFSASLQKDNFYATQFHPEKSADTGEQLLKNFLAL